MCVLLSHEVYLFPYAMNSSHQVVHVTVLCMRHSPAAEGVVGVVDPFHKVHVEPEAAPPGVRDIVRHGVAPLGLVGAYAAREHGQDVVS